MSYATIHTECHESLENLLQQHANLTEKTYDGERAFLNTVEAWIMQMREYIDEAETVQTMLDKMENRRKNLGIGKLAETKKPIIPEPKTPEPEIKPQPAKPLVKSNKPEPETKPMTNEDFLPPEIKNPNLATRLRIFRLNANFTVKQLAQRTGLDKTTIHGLEHGQLTPDNTIMNALAVAYKTTDTHLTKQPISDLLSFSPDQTVSERLRIARIRAGLSVEELAQKTREAKYVIEQYERKAPSESTVNKLADTLNIPRQLILTGDMLHPVTPTQPVKPVQPKPDSLFSDESTGDKLHRIRNQKAVSVQNLATQAGCSMSHIYSIERGTTIPSDDVLQKLALALNVNILDLVGNDIPQPNSVMREAATRRRLEPASNNQAKPNKSYSASTNTLTTEISRARMSKQLTTQDIAKKLGCSVTAFVELESIGMTKTNGPLLKRVANLLDIDLANFGIIL